MFYLFEALGWSLVAILGNYINHLHTLAHFLTKKIKAEKKSVNGILGSDGIQKNNKKPQFEVSEVPMRGSEIIFPCLMFLVIRGTKLPKATEFQMNAEPKTLESDRLLSYLHQDFNRAPGCLATDFDWLHYTLCVLRDDSLHCSADHHLSWRSTSLTGMYFFSKCNKSLKVRLWKCPRAPQSDIYSRVTQSFFFFFFFFCLFLHLKQEAQMSNESCVWQLSLRLPGSCSFC